MKKQTKKQTKNQKKYTDLAAGAMLAGAALMNPKRAMKLVKAKAAKKPAKQIPWEERRNEVLAKARAKLRETIAAGKAALENVTEASASKPAFKFTRTCPRFEVLAGMQMERSSNFGPYPFGDGPVRVKAFNRDIKWKSRYAALYWFASRIRGHLVDGSEPDARYIRALIDIIIPPSVKRGNEVFGGFQDSRNIPDEKCVMFGGIQ